MGEVETVGTLSRLKILLHHLSRELDCDATLNLKLSNPQLLTRLPQIAMSMNLSLIDAEEVKDGFIVTLANRFGDKCLTGEENASRRGRS